MRRLDHCRTLGTALIMLMVVSSAEAVSPPQISDEYPETLVTAISRFETQAEPEEWGDGPVSYLMLPEEKDVWDDLETDEHRRQFISWFWRRRDLDGRDERHDVLTGFYERVADANRRFHGFPRGWKSDRGRVWITLGEPTGGRRPEDMRNWGRCSSDRGEVWTYYSSSVAIGSSMGEFYVVFVESRVGTYEICEPTMTGVGAWPPDLRRAFEAVNASAIMDDVTEFVAGSAASGTSSTGVRVRETVARTEPLEVPFAEWGDDGVAGQVVIPVEVPLRSLLFEPRGDNLVATLQVDAKLVAMGTNDGPSGRNEWTVEIGPEDASAIGGGALRTAVVLAAEPGGYSAQVRIFEPISGTAWTWEGPVEIRGDGSSVSPPLVSRSLAQLRDGGEVAVLGRATARIASGQPFAVVAWVRGFVPVAEEVELLVYDAADNEVPLTDLRVSWGQEGAAGPIIVEAVAPAAIPGEYVLRLRLGPDQAPVETRVRIE